jgi:uncharacterized RDD family membrane protein YckC
MASKNVEIVTAHNIVIEYEVASVSDRIIAFIIDLAILIGWFILLFIFGMNMDEESKELMLNLLFTPVFCIYHLTCETFFGGQSIGKKAMSLKVVKMNGHNPTLGDCLLRWVLRVIDILASLGSLAAILVSSTDRGQRLGDMAANTVVIRLNPPNRYTIADILTINNKANYKPEFVDAVQFTDEDMLLIKNSIERLKIYPNPSSNKLIEELTQKVCQKLNVTEIPKDKIKFLRTVLQDYIVLTR